MVSRELEKPRPAWVLVRGQYDKHGEEVHAGVPSVLPPLPASEATNRLTFARWLVGSETSAYRARHGEFVFGRNFLGSGLSRPPKTSALKVNGRSHPELLDWLATEFLRTGWDVKQLVRLIVTSATYRQDCARHTKTPRGGSGKQAPGPRSALPARCEELRDNALYVSGSA